MERIKIFSHIDLDGIGCAVLAKVAFGDKNVDVEYCNYDDVNDKVWKFYNSGMDREYYRVYITDISIKEDLAEEIDRYGCGNWFLLDHHATATGLNRFGWCEVRVYYYNYGSEAWKTCGTELFYKELLVDRRFENIYGDSMKTIKRFVEIVRDYDTWRWKEELGEDGVVCKEVNDLFHIYGRDKFIEWCFDKIVCPLSPMLSFPSFDSSDRTLLNNKQKEIDIYVESKNKQLITIQDRFGYKCGIVFAERFVSELGNRLSEMHPELDYISMIDLGSRRISYRTVKDGIDLGGEIAHAFGGGGHKKAAGSTIDETFCWGIIAELFGEENDNVVSVKEWLL